MPRMFLTACAAAFLFVNSPAESAEDGKQPAGETVVPGFEASKLTWSQVDRILLIEGKEHETSPRGPEKTTHFSRVQASKFPAGSGRPVTAQKDPLIAALPENPDAVDRRARLKERGAKWKALLLEHNPAIRLEISHQESEKRTRLIGSPRVENKVLFTEVVYAPSEDVKRKAQAVDENAIAQKMQVHVDNKGQARSWYYTANIVLGCTAAAVVGFVMLPVIRRRGAAPPKSDR